MALQIDAPETIRLIERLSELTGESTETTVEIAVCERLDRLRHPDDEDRRRAELQALANRLASRFREPYRSVDHGDWLYDEGGLPR